MFLEFFFSAVLTFMPHVLARLNQKREKNTCFDGARFIGILIEIMKLKQTEEAMSRCTWSQSTDREPEREREEMGNKIIFKMICVNLAIDLNLSLYMHICLHLGPSAIRHLFG